MMAPAVSRYHVAGAFGRAARRSFARTRANRILFSHFATVPATTPSETLPAKLIDLEVSAKIEGEESQIATVNLSPGETLRAESGAMIFMTAGVEMDTSLGGGGAMKRFLTGQNVFLTDFTYTGDSQGTVALGTDFPSKILRLNLDQLPQQSLICQRGAFLASNPTVDIEMEFTKRLTAGFFGGEGFILQRLTGTGDVLVKGGGTIVVHDLAPGEKLRVTAGSLVAFEPTVEYDVQMIAGVKNAMFGGEGLFLTTLQGPGRVWLQGMPPNRMISEIARRVPAGGPGLAIPIGLGGGGSGDEAGEIADGVDGTVPVATGDAVAATTDETIAADRDATIASSGLSDGDVNAESPSSLFGDAVPEDTLIPNESSPVQSESDPFSTSDSFSSSSNEPTFEDDLFSSTEFEEPAIQDDEFLVNEGATDGELFDDSNTAGGGEDWEEAAEGATSLLRSVWDFFTGDD